MKKEKVENILLFILMFLNILSIIIINPINNLDELWNYNFARNSADGLIAYKDFNMLQMPLLPLICGAILKIIANELIVMRILASILCAGIFYITYKLFRLLKISEEFSIIFTFILAYLFKGLLCIDYNYATLILVLVIIYREIKIYQKEKVFLIAKMKYDIVLGILAGLTVTLKQTTGLFICIALLGNKLIFVNNIKKIKILVKSFAFRLIGIVIPIFFMMIYLILNNAFLDFISYTISGVSGFSNYIPYTNLLKYNLIGILSIIVPIAFVYGWYRTIILEKDKISYIFLVYGLAMFVVCFPISDPIHFLIGAMPTLILILYKIYIILKKVYEKYFKLKELKKNKILIFILLYLKYLIIISMIYLSIFNIYKYFTMEHSKLNHFKHIPISSDFEKQIQRISTYIEENKNVRILDASAAVYMIPINEYNKDYDMLLKGNLGKNGEERLIEKIKQTRDMQYLILNDKYTKNWQTPLAVINFVKENKIKTGEIEIFDIYK